MKRRLNKYMGALFFAAAYRIICRFRKVETDKVLFISNSGRLQGNLKCVFDHIENHSAFASGERVFRSCVFCYDDRIGIRSMKRLPRLAADLATAEYVLLEDCFYLTSYIDAARGQKICQLWHGAGAFKRFGFSRKGEDLHIHQGYRKYSRVTVSSEEVIQCYSDAFGIEEGCIRATGVPRTDIFFDAEAVNKKRKEIRDRYSWFRGREIILFAPTYRGTRIDEATYDFSRLDFGKLYEELSDRYVFLFKMHPAMLDDQAFKTAMEQAKTYEGFFRDISGELDINDMVMTADVMITDYSSVIFDYFLTGKPVVYYPYDLKEYESTRGFYFDYSEYLYGPAAADTAGLIKAVKEEQTCPELRERFGGKFMGACDGRSTDRACRWLFDMEDAK